MTRTAPLLGLWCILRTSGGRTLALTESLNAAGIGAWTPRQTLRRPVIGSRPDAKGRRPLVDVDAPILPTFVFAGAEHVDKLLALQSDPTNSHPPFSIFHHGPRIPLIADREVAGLVEAERAATELIARIREADSREEARRIRAAAMKTERERRKAMRAEIRHFSMGQAVDVTDAPALAGLSGVIESSDGRSAIVSFGGSLTMRIDSWRLVLNAV